MRTTVNVIITLAVVSFASFATEARHIHARAKEDYKQEKYEIEDGKSKISEILEYTGIMKAMLPYGFVPLNRDYVFKMAVPCPEEGFRRDVMGICREVWD